MWTQWIECDTKVNLRIQSIKFTYKRQIKFFLKIKALFNLREAFEIQRITKIVSKTLFWMKCFQIDLIRDTNPKASGL